MAAVIGWEMATLGELLADLGFMLVYGDPVSALILPEGHAIIANSKFPSAEMMISSYGEKSGRWLDNFEFHRALGYFKLAVIGEGIQNRFLAWQTVGLGFESVGNAVVPLVDAGLAMLTR